MKTITAEIEQIRRKIAGKHTSADFEKEKKALLDKLLEAFDMTGSMEGNSISGKQIREDLHRLMEKVKKQKFISWDEFKP